MARQKPDLTLPTFLVWGIDCDNVNMDVGNTTLEGLDDMEAISALNRLRYRLKSRLDEVERELARLEERNEFTEHPADRNRALMANVDRYMREQYPRELEIAIAEMEKNAAGLQSTT